ncbi:MAG: hypothetical protein H6811_10540 [Phycisphaeraceae bacterium]|nr:hypothetical protein [Phycisphaeraceae bacterium]
MWDASAVLEFCVDGLRARAAALDAEQAHSGLEALSELELQEVLRVGLHTAGLGVFAEQPFPGLNEGLPRRSERERCDIVLTARPDSAPIDPVARRAEIARAAGTLFEGSAEGLLAGEAGTPVEEAFWMEVKTVAQYSYVEGVPGPNRGYAGRLSACGTDLAKLARDPRIAFGGLILVMFTETEDVARHDTGLFVHACLDRDLSLSGPVQAGFAITDRVGNAWCHALLAPIRPDFTRLRVGPGGT